MRTRPLAAVLGVSVFVFAGLTSGAQAAFDKSELKCRKAVAKAFLKTVTTGDKASAACHKARNAGKIDEAINCNDLSASEADAKGKLAKAAAKLADAIQKKCIDAGIDADILSNYVSCTPSCTAELGIGDPIASYTALAQCLPCVARELVEERNLAMLGNPDQMMIEASKESRKCASAAAKGYGKHLSTILKTRTKCQDAADKAGAMELDAICQSSPDPDGKGKIAGALAKAEESLGKSCAGADLNVVGACATTSINDLEVCLAAQNAATDAVAFPAHYELGPAICPTGIRSEIRAGVGVFGASSTVIDVGWSGLSHRFDLPDAYAIVADVTCPNSEPPCGTCTVTGVRQSGATADQFMRCTNDFSIKCDEPFQVDADDCLGSICTVVLGPPLPISSGGTPTCSISALSADISGTTDVEAGEGSVSVQLASRVHTGSSASTTVPCPLCSGDDVAGDGIQNGVCVKGSRDGLPCDTQGFDATFAAQSAGLGLSLDCVPATIENISGTGLKISFDLTTGPQSLAAESPCDSPLDSLDCFCGLCTNDSTLACRNDSDCVSPGTCTTNTGGAPRRPNACNDLSQCADVGGDRGECSDKTDKFCEGLVRANGEGFLACSNDGECVNGSFPCPDFDCGPCSMVTPRPCFLDPIVVSGVPDDTDPVLAATFCIPPTVNPGINLTTGLPGPARIRVQQRTTRLYD